MTTFTIHACAHLSQHFTIPAAQNRSKLSWPGGFYFSPVGNLSSSSPDFPELPEWEKDWSPETGMKLLSAYREVEGEEPNFTNNAKVCNFVDSILFILK